MHFRPLAILLILLSAGSCFAQFTPAQPIPLDPNVRMGKLANGLTYYIRKNAKPANKVELRLAVNAGSVLETPDQLGLAHFMEHMNFNGSKNFPKNELVDYLQKVGVQFGADLNAYTSFDETVYMLPISSDNPEVLEKGFTVLEDWAFNNLLDKNEIEKERGVVLEESRLSKGADERMMRQYFPKMFNGSLYAQRLPIGKDSILKHFKYATLERFYRQWYRPNLMSVVVVGDIHPDSALAKIRTHFGKFSNPTNAPARPALIPIKPRTTPEAMVITDPEATNTMLQVLHFIRPSKKVVTWGDYRSEIRDELITSMINKRLQELTQKEAPPFVYGFTGKEAFIRGYEAFVSFAVLGEGNAKDAVDALIAENERVRKFGFLPAELERAKASMLTAAQQADAEKDKRESGQLVNAYVQHFLSGDPVPGASARYKFLQQVLPTITVAELNNIAKGLPPADKAFTLLTAPESKKATLPSKTALLAYTITAARQPVSAYKEKAVAQDIMGTGPVAGKVVEEKTNAKLGTTDLVLSNGVTITLKPTTFQNDEVLMDAWRWGGYHAFPLAEKDQAKFSAQLVGEMGVKDMSASDLKKFLAGKTVRVSPYVNEHEEGIEGSSSVKDFETFLQLVNLYFTQPRSDSSLFRSFVNKNKGMITYMRANPQMYFMDTLMKIVYNKNPWVDMVPTEATFTNLKLESVVKAYNQVFGNADGMHFTFVGNIDPAKAKPLFEKYLGSIPGKPVAHQYKDNNIRPLKGVTDIQLKKGKDAQSLVLFQWSGEAPYNGEDNLALSALIEVLNIRVIEKLREELGGMYSGGFNGSIVKRPYEHYTISAYIPCGPENVEKLSAALLSLIREAQEKGIDQKDLDKVKETKRKQLQVGMQENNFWLETLSNAFINQTDPARILEAEKRLDALSIADLQKAANRYFDMKNYFRAVLYPESAKIEPSIKKQF
jgi:zinc protease